MIDRFWKGKKIIVTGANGFLASHITYNLLLNHANVVGVIKEDMPLSFLNFKLREKNYKNIRLIKGNIIDYSFIRNLFRNYKPDICFHLAAQAIVGKANKSPVPTFKTNIIGTWNILEAVRELSLDTKVIAASSDKAYGEHKKLPYTEDAPLKALHPYDASKSCSDILTRTYACTYDLAAVVTRCANIYGPGDLNFSRIIPDTMRSAILKRNPIIRSNGKPLRDYVYIDDVVNAYFRLAKLFFIDTQRIRGEIFNFGTGKPISVLELVKMIIKISGNDKLRPKILSRTRIKGEIERQYLSNAKAGEILGWCPRCGLMEGLNKTFNWYKAYLNK